MTVALNKTCPVMVPLCFIRSNNLHTDRNVLEKLEKMSSKQVQAFQVSYKLKQNV